MSEASNGRCKHPVASRVAINLLNNRLVEGEINSQDIVDVATDPEAEEALEE